MEQEPSRDEDPIKLSDCSHWHYWLARRHAPASPATTEFHRTHFFGRLAPKGGCNPDGRGMFHWWNPLAFPNWCGPDDYCRKPMPNVCRPLHRQPFARHPLPPPPPHSP